MSEYPIPANLPDELRHIPAEIWLHAPNVWAGFCPSEGFNCIAFRIWRHGAWQSTLSEPASMADLAKRPLFYGTPALAPYVFGISEGKLTWGGETYQLINTREPRVLHGLSRDNAWAVVAHDQASDAASLSAVLRVGDPSDPASMERLAQWPFPCAIRADYVLARDNLTVSLNVKNTGEQPMPAAGGFHPYFDLEPRSGQPNDTLTMRGTMRRIADDSKGSLADADKDAAFAMNLADAVATLDDRRSMLDLFERADAIGAEREQPLCALEDASRGLTVQFHADRALPYVLNFISPGVEVMPPGHEVLSPVFSANLPGAFERLARGEESGLSILDPVQSWRGWLRISVA